MSRLTPGAWPFTVSLACVVRWNHRAEASSTGISRNRGNKEGCGRLRLGTAAWQFRSNVLCFWSDESSSLSVSMRLSSAPASLRTSESMLATVSCPDVSRAFCGTLQRCFPTLTAQQPRTCDRPFDPFQLASTARRCGRACSSLPSNDQLEPSCSRKVSVESSSTQERTTEDLTVE